jgi:hypothetical protein
LQFKTSTEALEILFILANILTFLGSSPYPKETGKQSKDENVSSA